MLKLDKKSFSENTKGHKKKTRDYVINYRSPGEMKIKRELNN